MVMNNRAFRTAEETGQPASLREGFIYQDRPSPSHSLSPTLVFGCSCCIREAILLGDHFMPRFEAEEQRREALYIYLAQIEVFHPSSR